MTVLYQKMGSFGCFDDCSNYMGGWFLLKGKVLYEQIFFNHQPLAAYVSAVIQGLGKPESIYQLIFLHRIFVFAFALFFGFLLLQKFGVKALIFLVLYESTKYYFFGDRFLAEGLIIYPLVYLLGLVLVGMQRRAISVFDVTVATASVWFVVWMREPYIPLALFLYAVFLFYIRDMRRRVASLSSFIIASLALFLLFPLADYYFSVITVNTSFHLQQPFTLKDFLNAFFYPLSVFLYGRENSLHIFEMMLSGIFLILGILTIKQKEAVKFLLVIFLTLGLANLRPTPPGTLYYEAFHMLSWYALFLFSLSFLLFRLPDLKRQSIFRGLLTIVFVSLFILLASPGSYIREKTNSEGLFYEGFNQYYTTGEVVRRLSTPDETLFLDGWNDLIYWQADRTSPYKYSWYTSVMSGFPRYTKAREELLTQSPPDFFYGSCKEWPFSKVTKKFLSSYRRFIFSSKPTCLYIKNEKAEQLTQAQLQDIAGFGYTLSN